MRHNESVKSFSILANILMAIKQRKQRSHYEQEYHENTIPLGDIVSWTAVRLF